MSTAQRVLASASAPSRLQSALNTLAAEASVLLVALLQPGKVLAEMDQMSKLLVAANALDGRDPRRAQMLRRRAASIGLK